MKKAIMACVLSLTALLLGGCTFNEHYMGFVSSTNGADTGKFKTANVTYENGKQKVFHNVKAYPYNNGGQDSTGGKIELRKGNSVYVLPDDAQVELRR